jgi:hypothetical protein
MKQKIRAKTKNRRTFFIASPEKFYQCKITDKSKKANLI